MEALTVLATTPTLNFFIVVHACLSLSMASLLIAPLLNSRYVRRIRDSDSSGRWMRAAVWLTVALSCMILILAVPASNGREVPETRRYFAPFAKGPVFAVHPPDLGRARTGHPRRRH